MKVKKIFPLLLIIFPYLLISPILFSIFHSSISVEWINKVAAMLFQHMMPWGVVSYLLVLTANLLYVVFAKASPTGLAFWNMVVKLCHIPFYIFIFIFGIGVMIAIPILWLIDVILMLTSSSFGISALVHAKCEGNISNTFMTVNILCHFLFVADVISAVITWRKLRK